LKVVTASLYIGFIIYKDMDTQTCSNTELVLKAAKNLKKTVNHYKPEKVAN